MSAKKRSGFDIDINISEDDLDELFEPFDPLARAEELEYPEIEGSEEGEPFEPLDLEYLHSLAEKVMPGIIDHYYRARIIGADKIPDQGPLIVASNHSGNAFPHDAMVLDALLWRHGGMTKEAKFRSVFSPKLAATWWMRPYALDNWWRKGGGIDMKFDNYDLLLKNNHRVCYYPEGVPGIGKGFNRRYQLQHFYSSFVVLASRHNAPVYPVYTINAEWVNPTSITIKWLDSLFDKLLKIPFFPIPTIFFVLIFPFIFYLGFPCNMVFVVGDPLDIKKMLKEEGAEPGTKDREALQRVADRVRQHMQGKLNEAVEEHGQKPYKAKEWLKKMAELGPKGFLKFSPFGWPFAFVQHYRDMKRPPARNKFTAFLRDLDILAFYIPFGWFLIALFRNIRKPPYGYRGLSKKERREQEGSYLWLLKKRPLPDMEVD